MSSLNWSAIGAIASAVSSFIALITVINLIKNSKDTRNDKQLSVQPWFHVSAVTKMGATVPLQLYIVNEGSQLIKVDSVMFKMDSLDLEYKLDFRFLRKSPLDSGIHRQIDCTIPYENRFFCKEAYLELFFTNFYGKKMKSISPIFKFNDRETEETKLFIEDEKFLFIPFSNQIIK